MKQRTEKLSFALTVDELKTVREYCMDRDVPISWLIRRALTEYMARHPERHQETIHTSAPRSPLTDIDWGNMAVEMAREIDIEVADEPAPPPGMTGEEIARRLYGGAGPANHRERQAGSPRYE